MKLVKGLLIFVGLLFAQLGWANSSSSDNPTLLQAVEQTLVVDGKPSRVFNLIQPDGTEGYVVARMGLAIITLATGAVLNTINGTFRGHVVQGNFLYATEETNGIEIYDISDKESPVPWNRFPLMVARWQLVTCIPRLSQS